MALFGSLRVQGGHLRVSECSLRPSADGRGSSTSAAERALSIDHGGDVVLKLVTISNYPAGAISVDWARLHLIDCLVKDSRAQAGGALLVSGADSMVMASSSRLINNSAALSGGALQVRTRLCPHHRRLHLCSHLPSIPHSPPRAQINGGTVRLQNRTLLEHNSAPQGSSIDRRPLGVLFYDLPAPPGRYLSLQQGYTLQVTVSDIDTFPLLCEAGYVGWPNAPADEQKRPECSAPW